MDNLVLVREHCSYKHLEEPSNKFNREQSLYWIAVQHLLIDSLQEVGMEIINSCLVLIQPRKNCSYITERLLMGCKESNQTKPNMYEDSHLLSGIFFTQFLQK